MRIIQVLLYTNASSGLVTVLVGLDKFACAVCGIFTHISQKENTLEENTGMACRKMIS